MEESENEESTGGSSAYLLSKSISPELQVFLQLENGLIEILAYRAREKDWMR